MEETVQDKVSYIGAQCKNKEDDGPYKGKRIQCFEYDTNTIVRRRCYTCEVSKVSLKLKNITSYIFDIEKM